MNKIKELQFDKYTKIIEINDSRFMVYKIDSGEWDDKNCRPIMRDTVKISPDYNPSANFTISAPTIKTLVKKLEKIDYQIVKPHNGR